MIASSAALQSRHIVQLQATGRCWTSPHTFKDGLAFSLPAGIQCPRHALERSQPSCHT
jgi:hypothetical protein